MWLIDATVDPSLSRLGSIDRDFVLLLIGWVLGIASSPITDAIRRRTVKVRLSRALRTELRSLQDTLAFVVIQLARRRGVLSRSLLEALMSTLQASGQVASHGRALKAIEGLLEADELAQTGGALPAPPPHPLAPPALRVNGGSFLDAHFHRLDLYSVGTQRLLVELHAGTAVYNQHVNEAMNYHLMTFDTGIGKARREALLTAIDTCFERAAERASDLVSRIAELLQTPEMKNA